MPRENLATRVANAIREQVQQGALQRGSQLRSEVELSRDLGVSRQTLREATRMLTLEGLLTIRHGMGTFVTDPPVTLSSPLNSMHSMSALIRANGGEPSIRELKVRRLTATAEVATALQISASSPVAEILRVRLISGKPLAVAYDYIALQERPEETLQLIQSFDGGSIYDFMRTKLQMPLLSSEASLTAVAAGKRHADLLKVKQGFPLLLVREIHMTGKQSHGLYSTVFHNSTLMEFTLVRPGSPGNHVSKV